jgi:hypothetical protein
MGDTVAGAVLVCFRFCVFATSPQVQAGLRRAGPVLHRSIFIWGLAAVAAVPNLYGMTHRVPAPLVTRAGAGVGQHPVATKPPANWGPIAPHWGLDISWPQCVNGLPGGKFDVATVGVTGGQPYTTNPCLADEYRWASAASSGVPPQLYINLDLDGLPYGIRDCADDDHPCRAFNYGALAVTVAVQYAASQGVHSNFWWLDVETGNAWSDIHPDWNAAVVAGAIDELQRRHLHAGVYSTSQQWVQIVSDYRPAVPSWPAVYTDPGSAPGACNPGSSFTAGPVLMVQYNGDDVDKDYVCDAGSKALVQAALPNLKLPLKPIKIK